MRYTKFQYWVKLQRKFRNTQERLLLKSNARLNRKLENLKKRILTLNHKWRVGISTSVLTAWFAFSPNVSVHAQGPVYSSPVEVNNLNDQEGSYLVSDDGELGTVVTNIGDFNGDGINDIAVSAPEEGYFGDRDGVVYIVFGKTGVAPFVNVDINNLSNVDGLKIVGGEDRDYLGRVLTSVGDINGDSFNDVAIGVSTNDVTGTNAGAVFVIFGTSEIATQDSINVSGLDGTNGVAIYGEDGDNFGRNVSSAGDVNNDNINDFAITSRGNGTQIIYGNETIGNDTIYDLSTFDETKGFSITSGGTNLIASAVTSIDMNGDGIDDIVISNGSGTGIAHVVFGKTGSFGESVETNDLTATTGFSISGRTEDASIGNFLENIGDINNDGVDDLALGAKNTVHVVFGTGSVSDGRLDVEDLTGVNGFTVYGKPNRYQPFGKALGAAGDFNGDNIDDFMIGSPRDNKNGRYSGSSYLIFGGQDYPSEIESSSIDGKSGIVFVGEVDVFGAKAGTSVSYLNDINGDGTDELLIGMPELAFRDGRVAVVLGMNEPTELGLVNPIQDFIIYEDVLYSFLIPDNIFTSANVTDEFNFSAKLADGNDLPSWLTFDPLMKTFSGIPKNGDTGSVSIILTLESEGTVVTDQFEISVIDAALFPAIQSASGLNNELLGSIILGGSGNVTRETGRSVSSAGDINGDGIDDILIGVSRAQYDVYNAGAGIVVFGNEEGIDPDFQFTDIDGTNGFIIAGTTRNYKAGQSVSSLGDINGDGLDDVIVGAPTYGGRGIAGRSYVVFGSTDVFPRILNQANLDGTNGFTVIANEVNTDFGNSVGHAGDVNGDGLNDIIIGAYSTNTGSLTKVGAAHVIFGRDYITDPFGAILNMEDLQTEQGVTLLGLATSDEFGKSVNGVGDINNDGLDDFAIGAYKADVNGSSSGSTYIVFGNESLQDTLDVTTINGANGFAIHGLTSSDVLGTSVNKAGDFNNDGIDDLIVGSPSTLTGDSYILFGTESAFGSVFDLTTLNGANGISIIGSNSKDLAGISVSHAGDVNGDGIDDVIIGASQAMIDGETRGTANVVFGKEVWDTGLFNLNEIDGSNGFTVVATDEFSGGFGTVVGGLGDVNSDGFDDVIIGSPREFYSEYSNFGAAYIVYGKGPSAPTVKKPIDDQCVQVGFSLDFIIPDSTFNDKNFGDELTYTATLADASTLPSWLTFTANTGLFSGMPGLSEVGVYSILVTATDEDGLSTIELFNLSVVENKPPVIDEIEAKEVDENENLTFVVTATDLETISEDLIFSLDNTSVQKGMSISLNSGVFSWTPSEIQSGDHIVTVIVSDGDAQSEKSVNITVNENDSAPVLALVNNLSVSFENEATFTATATDSDVPVQKLSFTIDENSNNKGMRIDTTSGVFSWIPTEEQKGQHTIILTVSDGELTDAQAFEIIVEDPVAVHSFDELETLIYPNPVEDKLTIDLKNNFSNTEIDLNITTLTGVSLMSRTITNDQVALDLKSFKNGSYLLILSTKDGKQKISKIIKQ